MVFLTGLQLHDMCVHFKAPCQKYPPLVANEYRSQNKRIEVNICCLILIVLWHREVISYRKETRCVPLECRIRTLEVWNTKSPETECPLTDRLSCRGSSFNLNSTARPYDEWGFSPFDFTVGGSLRHQIATRLIADSQTDWAVEDQAKKTERNNPSL